MTDANIKSLVEAQRRFMMHFEYFPNLPEELEFDILAYIKLLEQCILEDFDYTIKLYGTKPARLPLGRQPGDLIID